MKRAWAAAIAALPITVAAAQAASVTRTYAYFDIYGNSAADLDRQLRDRGPFLESDKTHHAGASTMRFDTTVKYRNSGGMCSIAKVDVSLSARITLPRWHRTDASSDPDLAIVWDALSQDIRRHEEGHVSLARRNAERLEADIRRLPPRRGCDALKADVARTTEIVLARDDRDQQAYDRAEQAGFKRRFGRLLSRRLEMGGQ